MMRANMFRELHHVVVHGKVMTWKNRPARMLVKIGVASFSGGYAVPNDKTVASYEEQIAEHTRHSDLALVLEHTRRRRREMYEERHGKPTPFCKVETLRPRERRWCPAQPIRRVYIKTPITADLLRQSASAADAFRTVVRREMGKAVRSLNKRLMRMYTPGKPRS